jgi:hypothetical protein
MCWRTTWPMRRPGLPGRDAGLPRGAGARRRRQHAFLCAGDDGGLQPAPGPVQRHRPQPGRGRCGQCLAGRAGVDGTEAYTRAGALHVDAEGVLVTRGGLPVLGDGGPITIPPNARVLIAPTAPSPPPWSAAARRSRRGPLKLVTPEAPLVRGADGLFRAAEGTTCRPTPPPVCSPAHWKAQQREPGRDDGGDDLGRAPVRAADEDAADRAGARTVGHPAAVDQLTRAAARPPAQPERSTARAVLFACWAGSSCHDHRPSDMATKGAA